jgi:hypothetical protein
LPALISSELPTLKPIAKPSELPTLKPSELPTLKPIELPTSKAPSLAPNVVPTIAPRAVSTMKPSNIPNSVPTSIRTVLPTGMSAVKPTIQPITVLTAIPSSHSFSLEEQKSRTPAISIKYNVFDGFYEIFFENAYEQDADSENLWNAFASAITDGIQGVIDDLAEDVNLSKLQKAVTQHGLSIITFSESFVDDFQEKNELNSEDKFKNAFQALGANAAGVFLSVGVTAVTGVAVAGYGLPVLGVWAGSFAIGFTTDVLYDKYVKDDVDKWFGEIYDDTKLLVSVAVESLVAPVILGAVPPVNCVAYCC